MEMSTVEFQNWIMALYIGLFTVLRMIGDNAVELDGLPERMPTTLNTEYIHPYRTGDNARLEEMRQSPLPPQPQ